MTGILFVCREYPPSRRLGGIGVHIATISKALAASGFQVYVLCASDKWTASSSYKDGDVFVHRLSFPDYWPGKSIASKILNRVIRRVLYTNYRKRLSRAIGRLCEAHAINIVEFAEYGAEGIAWVAHRSAYPALVTRLHGPSLLNRDTGGAFEVIDRRQANEIEQILHSDRVTSPSVAMTNWFINVAGLSKEVITLPNFVEYDFWAEGAVSRPQSNMIFFAGTVAKGKGCFELAEAVRQLRTEFPDICLVLAGRGGEDLRNIISKYSQDTPNNWLKYVGPLNRVELRSYFSDALVSVFPSHWEPFGLVCAEAMASGALVIASNKGGMAEIIEESYSGILTSPSVDGLIAAIKAVLLMNEDDRLKMRQRARQRVLDEFSDKAILPRFAEFYTQVARQCERSVAGAE